MENSELTLAFCAALLSCEWISKGAIFYFIVPQTLHFIKFPFEYKKSFFTQDVQSDRGYYNPGLSLHYHSYLKKIQFLIPTRRTKRKKAVGYLTLGVRFPLCQLFAHVARCVSSGCSVQSRFA